MIFSYGFQLEEELLRILKFENKLKCSGVEMLLKAWDIQYDKLKAFILQQFSLRKDEVTGMQKKFEEASSKVTCSGSWYMYMFC